MLSAYAIRMDLGAVIASASEAAKEQQGSGVCSCVASPSARNDGKISASLGSDLTLIDRVTLLLQKAMVTASALPPAVQDEIARVVMEMAGEDPSVYIYSAEGNARLDESEAAAARGEFATDEQIRAIWAKHGL